ncbi:MAG TPA: hypothetical protein VKV36_12390, partial [Acidimicrobiales bacterium]|nr:hypothetical protein [Acidimicrobiales bacterium]
AVAGQVVFEVGLAVAVVAAVLAAWAFLPRRYPVLEVERLRQANLTASEGEATAPAGRRLWCRCAIGGRQ